MFCLYPDTAIWSMPSSGSYTTKFDRASRQRKTKYLLPNMKWTKPSFIDLEGGKEERTEAKRAFVFHMLWEWLLEKQVLDNGSWGGLPLLTKPCSVQTCLCIKLCT